MSMTPPPPPAHPSLAAKWPIQGYAQRKLKSTYSYPTIFVSDGHLSVPPTVHSLHVIAIESFKEEI